MSRPTHGIVCCVCFVTAGNDGMARFRCAEYKDKGYTTGCESLRYLKRVYKVFPCALMYGIELGGGDTKGGQRDGEKRAIRGEKNREERWGGACDPCVGVEQQLAPVLGGFRWDIGSSGSQI